VAARAEPRENFITDSAGRRRDLVDADITADKRGMVAAMNRAARIFVGEHDFAAFRSLGTEVRTTVRCVTSSEWTRDADLLLYRVEANSFLRHMVRAMVATMIDVGRGKITVEKVATILAGLDRGAVPANAPPGGLYLVEVRY